MEKTEDFSTIYEQARKRNFLRLVHGITSELAPYLPLHFQKREKIVDILECLALEEGLSLPTDVWKIIADYVCCLPTHIFGLAYDDDISNIHWFSELGDGIVLQFLDDGIDELSSYRFEQHKIYFALTTRDIPVSADLGQLFVLELYRMKYARENEKFLAPLYVEFFPTVCAKDLSKFIP